MLTKVVITKKSDTLDDNHNLMGHLVEKILLLSFYFVKIVVAV